MQSSEDSKGWRLTFASSSHLLRDRRYFVEFREYAQPKTLRVSNDRGHVEAFGEGEVVLHDAHGRSSILRKVLYVPSLALHSYLSVRALVQDNGKATLDGD